MAILQVSTPIIPVPTPTPTPPAGYTTVTINMTDIGSNGWNGNVLGLSQNGVVIASFGANFTAGAKFGPVLATIPNATQTSIVVVKLGTYTYEIGFSIYALNGTLLFSRTPYTAFDGSAPLGTFCPIPNVLCQFQSLIISLFPVHAETGGEETLC